MSIQEVDDMSHAGTEMLRMIETLYPICRSITGDGVRTTLAELAKHIPIEISEVPSGTQVFDWTVPKEWNIQGAYIKDPSGKKIVDFQDSNLHILNYSVPVDKKLALSELKEHLFTLPEHPKWIPYRTSYYNENWGFCLSHQQYLGLEEGEYEVVIDSSLEDGHLTYAEYYLPGESEEEILLSCHICHPSLCNDNLSGIAMTTFLAKYLAGKSQRRYSYRFLYIPGTIGSITWLARNESKINTIKHGLVVVCVGDAGQFSYKKSRQGDAEIDRVVQHVLTHTCDAFNTQDFYPYGYDERQYCSPGIDLSVGSLSRSSHGSFPEYHTSADNLDLICQDSLQESLAVYQEVMAVLEQNKTYLNQNPKCEPQLGKRGLYRKVGAPGAKKIDEMAMLWVLNMSDGRHSLLDIAERSATPFREISFAASELERSGLLVEV